MNTNNTFVGDSPNNPSALPAEITNLYNIFSKVYPLKEYFITTCCPCCVVAEDRKTILKPLQTLTKEDLQCYLNNALHTWGDTEDFKYFLPRILEINTYEYETFVLLSNLEYCNWLCWPKVEQQALLDFFIYNFYDLLKNAKFYLAHEWGNFLIDLKRKFAVDLDLDIILVKNIFEEFLKSNQPQPNTALGYFFTIVLKSFNHDQITFFLNVFAQQNILHLAFIIYEDCSHFWDNKIFSKKNFPKAEE